MCDFVSSDLALLKRRLHVVRKAKFSSTSSGTTAAATTAVKARDMTTTKSMSTPSTPGAVSAASPIISTDTIPWYLMTAEQAYQHELKLQRKEQKEKEKKAKTTTSSPSIQRSNISARRASTVANINSAKLAKSHVSVSRSPSAKLTASSTTSTAPTATILTPKELSRRKLRTKDLKQQILSVNEELSSLTASVSADRHTLQVNHRLLQLQQREISLTKQKLSDIYDAAIAYLNKNNANSISNSNIDVSIFTLSKRHHSKRHKHYTTTNITTTTKQMLRAESVLKKHERFEYLWSVVRAFIRAIGKQKVLEKRKQQEALRKTNHEPS